VDEKSELIEHGPHSSWCLTREKWLHKFALIAESCDVLRTYRTLCPFFSLEWGLKQLLAIGRIAGRLKEGCVWGIVTDE
jgi:hypothetical protein